MNFSRGSGSGGTSILYYGTENGGWFSDVNAQNAVYGPITVPTPTTGARFLGYFSDSSGGTKYINEDGTFTASFASLTLTEDATCYAQYETVYHLVTLNQGVGSGGTQYLYYKINGGGIYQDANLTSMAYSITVPSATSQRFCGYWWSYGGQSYQCINADGTLQDHFRNNTGFWEPITLTSVWHTVYSITLNKGAGSGGTSSFYYDATENAYYDETLTNTISSILPPTKPGATFLGYYSAQSGGTKYINEDGSFTSSFPTVSSNLIFYAQWDVAAIILTLNANGGDGAPPILYYKNASWYSDTSYTNPITSITVPTRAGYTFGGYYNGSNLVISSAGSILISSISTDTNATASWGANTYTLTFDYNGGTSGVASKTVTSGVAVGSLPTTSKADVYFDGWYAFGAKITAETIWAYAGDVTAVARFVGSFGSVVDYFGFESNALIPELSDSGDTHQHTCAYNATSEYPATETSAIWRNPTVTYKVVGDTTFSATLGLAYPATGSTVSGYMITSVTISTGIGVPPTVTVAATANEGANAIQMYNVAMAVSRRHRPQNLMNAIYGGGDLQSLTLTAACDPVVVAENGMPCASDVCHGRIEVSAQTNAYNNESAPTASAQFVKVGEPVSFDGVGYKTFNVKVRKEL